jgi:hypothetical protein
MSEYGHVHVGLWMKSPQECEIMLKALEAGMRQLARDDPDRPKLEEWRRQALNIGNRSVTEEWTGWSKPT